MQALHLAKQNINQQRRLDGLTAKSSSVLVSPLASAGFPFATGDAFNIEYIFEDKVKLSGGEIQIADRVPVACAALEVQITADYSKVGYEYTYATGAFTIKNFGSTITYDSAHYRKWLYEFRLVDGVAYYERNGVLNPSLPSNFGDTPA